ncbi:TEF transcription factor, PAR bZIP family member a [Thalassophryne amazonica]|uniref:TEF transcription factor, PAR bZIP family member a n=1 Tax=Thalassophryne amazonica TaxID=390379 RepID=UPI0014714907|nr:TEF transcription factor, PAR bZIP family member a [Thalassophryne amazonica]
MSGSQRMLFETGSKVAGSFPVVLKKILEMSTPNGPDNDGGSGKTKLHLGDVDLDSEGSDVGTSAALTPAIWEKNFPFDGKNIHLEYMDLEEFFLENCIPVSAEEEKPSPEGKLEPINFDKQKVAKEAGNTTAGLLSESDDCEEEVVIIKNDSDLSCDITTEVTTEPDRATPESVDPDDIMVDINYELDPTDLVLSTVPGGKLFDPRKHKFTEDELKPQPMVKKARKVFVPEEKKDEKYWQRRRKNNMAAKRSREARRLKENQIAVRAAFLECENTALRSEVAKLQRDCNRYKKTVCCYQSKFGQL